MDTLDQWAPAMRVSYDPPRLQRDCVKIIYALGCDRPFKYNPRLLLRCHVDPRIYMATPTSTEFEMAAGGIMEIRVRVFFQRSLLQRLLPAARIASDSAVCSLL